MGPMARRRGWAPGHVMDWKEGAAGWVLWVSLAIMLGDSLSSLALLSGSTSYHALRQWCSSVPPQLSNADVTRCRPLCELRWRLGGSLYPCTF